MTTTAEGYGRRIPTDFEHIEHYPFEATVSAVERVLPLPTWHSTWIQGDRNACVGFGTSLMMSILNFLEDGIWRKYDPWWLWDRAKERDEWADTNPGDNNGTSVRAACSVLKALGHKLDGKVALVEGITEYRWATTVDNIRASIALGIPVSFAITWESGLDTPVSYGGEWWIGRGARGFSRGGHDTCIFGASDRRQAFWLGNSWKGVPPALIPYERAGALLSEYGEASLVTDRRRPRVHRRDDDDR